MKKYPSIPKNIDDIKNQQVVIFDKLDGSNIRAEWVRSSGFYKFGSRKQLLQPSSLIYQSIELIKRDYEEWLDIIFRQNNWRKVTAFFEFYGDHSKFGQHDPKDKHKVTLIDVWVSKNGFVEPLRFIRMFKTLGIPNVLFNGKLSDQILKQIKDGTLLGMGREGVICKMSKGTAVSMVKVKRNSWYEELRERCDDNEKLFQKLS